MNVDVIEIAREILGLGVRANPASAGYSDGYDGSCFCGVNKIEISYGLR